MYYTGFIGAIAQTAPLIVKTMTPTIKSPGMVEKWYLSNTPPIFQNKINRQISGITHPKMSCSSKLFPCAMLDANALIPLDFGETTVPISLL